MFARSARSSNSAGRWCEWTGIFLLRLGSSRGLETTQVSAWKFRKSKDVALYSNYAFRRLNTRVSVFSFYEAATDPIFQPLELFEFSLQFGCGSLLKFRDDFVCVEIDAHDCDPEVKFAGMLPFNSTPTRADQRHGFQSARAVR
jgi:hypothetical protein